MSINPKAKQMEELQIDAPTSFNAEIPLQSCRWWCHMVSQSEPGWNLDYMTLSCYMLIILIDWDFNCWSTCFILFPHISISPSEKPWTLTLKWRAVHRGESQRANPEGLQLRGLVQLEGLQLLIHRPWWQTKDVQRRPKTKGKPSCMWAFRCLQIKSCHWLIHLDTPSNHKQHFSNLNNARHPWSSLQDLRALWWRQFIPCVGCSTFTEQRSRLVDSSTKHLYSGNVFFKYLAWHRSRSMAASSQLNDTLLTSPQRSH